MVGKKKGPTYGEALDQGPRIRGGDSCSLDMTIQLQAVDPEQAKDLKIGRKLGISLRRHAGVKSVVCVRLDNNKHLGSVAFTGVDKLIACMEKGRQYEAELSAIKGAAVHVRIYDC